MSAAKLPKWAQAIGSMLAEQFGVSDEPLPLELIRRMVAFRVAENRARAGSRGRKR